MTPDEAIETIRGRAGANRIHVSHHAELQMEKRGVEYEDVRRSLMTATRCVQETEERWRAEGGVDVAGDVLSVVVAIVGDLVVVTVF